MATTPSELETGDCVATGFISTITRIDGLNSVRNFWEQTQWHPSSDMSLFLSDIKARPEVLGPHVLHYQDENTEGLLIGRTVSGPLGLHLGYRLLGWPQVRALEFVEGGILGQLSSGLCELFLTEIGGILRRKEADVAVFRNLPVDSLMHEVIGKRFHFPNLGIQPAMTWSVSLPGSYREFMLGLSKRTRATSVRYSNLIRKKYGDRMQLRVFRSREDFDRILRDTETVASKTWQRGVHKGFRCDGETRERYRIALGREELRAYLLYVDEKPIAFWHGLCYRGVFYAQYTGFDPDYRDDRPGAYMLSKIIEELCEAQGVHEMDFGEGDHEYKQHYCRQGLPVADLYIYSPTIYGLGLSAIKTSFDRTKAGAKALLREAKLLNRTRRSWKQRLARA